MSYVTGLRWNVSSNSYHRIIFCSPTTTAEIIPSLFRAWFDSTLYFCSSTYSATSSSGLTDGRLIKNKFSRVFLLFLLLKCYEEYRRRKFLNKKIEKFPSFRAIQLPGPQKDTRGPSLWLLTPKNDVPETFVLVLVGKMSPAKNKRMDSRQCLSLPRCNFFTIHPGESEPFRNFGFGDRFY